MVAWEDGQRIDVVFERLQVENLGHRGGREIAVVVRHDQYEGLTPREAVNLLKLFDDPEEAEAEAARLNGLRPGDVDEYFVTYLRDRRGAR